MPEVRLLRLRPKPAKNALEDKTFVLISVEQAAKYGIELDETNFPTIETLENWHKRNNPHLFADES
jgi:hypothetical protein